MTQALPPISRPMVGELQQLVYVTPGSVQLNGERDGGELDVALRCDRVRYEAGPRVGFAEFTHVPLTRDDDAQAFDRIISRYSTDDLVRVSVLPYEDELSGSGSDDVDRATTLFIGRLARPIVEIARDAQTNQERVRFVATALPVLDNQATEHQVGGRWVRNPANGKVEVIAAISLPAIANFRGRPNRSTRTVLTHDTDLAFFPFTHDDDPTAQHWTAAQFLLSIIGQWLFGSNSFGPDYAPQKRNRTFGVPDDLLAALAATEPASDRWRGLYDALPEVNVHGMGVLDAIDAVCQSIGWQMAIRPDLTGEAERPYILDIWRRNSGDVIYPRLAPRGTVYADHEAGIKANDVSKVLMVRDAGEICNEVFATGRTLIETSIPLLPLWNPSEVDATEITAALQLDLSAAGESSYHSRHVAGGGLFGQYAHVGRRWGIDCVGGFAGYSDSYAHSPEGADWVTFFDLNNPDGLIARQRARFNAGTPIYWTKRIRPALPSRHPSMIARGRDYTLEVSEDGGANYAEIPVQFETLRDALGIMLHVANLARVNLATLGTNEVPPVAESWWALIASRQLLFALTCAIEADHAVSCNARRQATSGSSYYLGKVVLDSSIEQRLRHPWHVYAAEDGIDGWAEITPAGVVSGENTSTAIVTAAISRRDATESAVISGTLATWIMDLDRYVIGQQVGGLDGRNFSFAVNAGQQRVYPNIVGITYELGRNAQAMLITLDDQRLAGVR